MKYPTIQEEKKLWKKGYKRVVGLDEAGRGALAGPVVACAVISNWKKSDPLRRSDLKKLRDSKELTPKKREEFYKILTNHPAIEWSTGKVSEKVIDKINILEATKLAMKRAILKMSDRTFLEKVDFLIIDGNFEIKSKIPQKSMIKADERVLSCACASIIAKVTRDRIMQKYHKKYPQYGFDRHKGYPTKLHHQALKKYGPCQIHRKSFKM